MAEAPLSEKVKGRDFTAWTMVFPMVGLDIHLYLERNSEEASASNVSC